MKEPPVRNFRLQVKANRQEGTWTVWNLLQEGDEKVVPLRKTPPERLTQYKVAFPGMVARIPCAITTELPRIVFEMGFWDDSSIWVERGPFLACSELTSIEVCRREAP